MYKVHLNSTSGYWPCGATSPHETSDNLDDVTCHLCKKWIDDQIARGNSGIPT
ncbi:hypothetical protein MOX01_23200 [Microbacterium oxydans]|nr:hypothetical protein MOX01_23200 [Microbacterium oxydans]